MEPDKNQPQNPPSASESQPAAMDVVAPRQPSGSSTDNELNDYVANTVPTADQPAGNDSSVTLKAASETSSAGSKKKKVKPQKEKKSPKAKPPKPSKDSGGKPVGFIIFAIVISLIVSGLLVMSYVEQGQAPIDDSEADVSVPAEPATDDVEPLPEPIDQPPDDDFIDEPPMGDIPGGDQPVDDEDVIDPDTPTSNE